MVGASCIRGGPERPATGGLTTLDPRPPSRGDGATEPCRSRSASSTVRQWHPTCSAGPGHRRRSSSRSRPPRHVGDARVDAGQNDRRQVVTLDRVHTGSSPFRSLYSVAKASGAGPHGQDRIAPLDGAPACSTNCGSLVPSRGDESRGDTGRAAAARTARPPRSSRRRRPRPARRLDQLDRRGEVLVADLHLAAQIIGRGTQHRVDLLGKAHTVGGAVVDDADLLEAQRLGQVVRDRGPWTPSLARPLKKFVQPLVVSETRVGGDAVSDSRSAWKKIGPVALVSPENAGPSRPMSGVADDLRGDLGGLLRVTLGVELLEHDLAIRVGLVVLLDGHFGAIENVDAERGIRHRLARRPSRSWWWRRISHCRHLWG